MSDFLLFSPDIYRSLIERLNESVWPAQIYLLALAVLLTWLVFRPGGERWIAALLAAAWASVGWVFHWETLSTINWAALGYGVAFAVQALLLAIVVAFPRLFVLKPSRAALALLVFGLFLLPLAGPLIGRPWSQLEFFGLLPDPTVVATLGVLAMVRGAWFLWPIPLLWCALAGATAYTLEDPLWPVMPVAGLLALVLALMPKSTKEHAR